MSAFRQRSSRCTVLAVSVAWWYVRTIHNTVRNRAQVLRNVPTVCATRTVAGAQRTARMVMVCARKVRSMDRRIIRPVPRALQSIKREAKHLPMRPNRSGGTTSSVLRRMSVQTGITTATQNRNAVSIISMDTSVFALRDTTRRALGEVAPVCLFVVKGACADCAPSRMCAGVTLGMSVRTVASSVSATGTRTVPGRINSISVATVTTTRWVHSVKNVYRFTSVIHGTVARAYLACSTVTDRRISASHGIRRQRCGICPGRS